MSLQGKKIVHSTTSAVGVGLKHHIEVYCSLYILGTHSRGCGDTMNCSVHCDDTTARYHSPPEAGPILKDLLHTT